MITNEVKEIQPGIFSTVLGFPDEDKLIETLVDVELPFVLLCGFTWGNFTWQKFELHGVRNVSGYARELSGDTVVTTKEFMASHSTFKWRWAIQIKCMPPDYFDFEKIQGPERYRILAECGFRFIVESQPGGGDYCQLISPFRRLVQMAIDNANA